MGIFWSLFSALILLGIYVLFLGPNIAAGYDSVPDFNRLLFSWLLSGVIGITSITSSMNALELYLSDRQNGAYKDFLISPVRSWKVTASYIFAAYLYGLVMTFFTFILSEIYLVSVLGCALLTGAELAQLIGYLLVIVFSSTAMMFFFVLLFNRKETFSNFITIVSTIIGFLTGMYIPVGTMGEAMRAIVMNFPLTQGVVLIRNSMMKSTLADSFSKAPQSALTAFTKDMGVTNDTHFFGIENLELSSFVYVFTFGLVMFLLATFVMKMKNHGSLKIGMKLSLKKQV